ncbi:MAG: hypothetical protein QM783_07080 [Phycisphaerales bacterium]
MAIQMYGDEQKSTYINVLVRPNPAAQPIREHTLATLILEEHLGGARKWLDTDYSPPNIMSDLRKPDPFVQKFFECPAARGTRSVRDPSNIDFLQSGGRYYTWLPAEHDPSAMVRWSEYMFNDNALAAGKPFHSFKDVNKMVWAIDALDDVPRHQDREMKSSNLSGNASGTNNVLFGDTHVATLTFRDYKQRTLRDGSSYPFWDWGLASPE